MANARLTPRPSPDLPDPEIAARDESLEEEARSSSQHKNFAHVVDTLRASDLQQDPDTLLSGVTLAALELTGATGAALALRTEGAVVCRARVGETAPPVGTQLDEHSGISGECLRTGVSQLCSDVSTDSRVDAEASQRLGVQSLAAVPLLDQGKVIGILEIFSGRARAFSDSDVALLRHLADIAVSSNSPAAETRPPVSVRKPEERRVSSDPSPIPQTSSERVFTRVTGDLSLPRLAAFVIVLAVLLSSGWFLWRAFRQPTSQAQVTNGTPVQGSPGGTGGASPSAPSSPDSGGHPVSEKPSAGINIAASDVVVRASGTAPLHRDVPLQVVTPGKGTPAEEVVPPANSQLLNDPESSLVQLPPGIVISSVRLPPAPPEVSLGVTGGTLVHRVPPAYPKLARDKKLEGEVVLAAIVGEDGRLHDMSVVSGDPILAQAARQAVAQWRYSPYQLNGKPVSIRTNITVQFKFQP